MVPKISMFSLLLGTPSPHSSTRETESIIMPKPKQSDDQGTAATVTEPVTEETATEGQDPAAAAATVNEESKAITDNLSDPYHKQISELFHKWFVMAHKRVCQSAQGTGIDVFDPKGASARRYALALEGNAKKAIQASGIIGYSIASMSIRGADSDGNQIRFTCDDLEGIKQSDDENRGKWWTVAAMMCQSPEDAVQAANALGEAKFAAITFNDLREFPEAEECLGQYEAMENATQRVGGSNLYKKQGTHLFNLANMVLIWEPSGAPGLEQTCWTNRNLMREASLSAQVPSGNLSAAIGGEGSSLGLGQA